ncbi:hypothetical protein TNCV_4774081 [Trichonephila clavipes]|nr:hypothetical protein TNCV_4774081 [Trichonephila clavipes]
MRAISNEPFNFDHWSSSESDTLVGISFCKLLDHANVKSLSLDARSSVVRENILKNNLTSRARFYRLTLFGTLKTGPPHLLFRRVYPERRGTGF